MKLFRRATHHDDTELAPADAHARQQRGALLVDVREPREWAQGHAPAARHIPLGSLAGQLGGLPGVQEILFICHSGARSDLATDMARARGLDAKNVAGGMSAWARAGLPVERQQSDQ